MHTTEHRLLHSDARTLDGIANSSISTVVTSPPYPMIEMWDASFAGMDPVIAELLSNGDSAGAFAHMHQELDKVWREVQRVLISGGFACINIGDATRTFGGVFQLYPNAERITRTFSELGFEVLPRIIWRKTTNAPNKFMGSGMLPAGAYVTLEHEYVLVFRKGGRRDFSESACKELRQQSAYFWEERNTWFSDVWFGLNGATQSSGTSGRQRNGAYPLELPYRLINMYSIKGDTILDPFLGTGTTAMASIASGRNSVGVEIDQEFLDLSEQRIMAEWYRLNNTITKRLRRHEEYASEAQKQGKVFRYRNSNHQIEVMTRQEVNLSLEWIADLSKTNGTIVVNYTARQSEGKDSADWQLKLFD